jgi:hypothetical protein
VRAFLPIATLFGAVACGNLLSIEPEEEPHVLDGAVEKQPLDDGSLDGGADATASDAAPEAARGKLVFVTTAVYRGALGGLDGGDDLCTREARSSGLAGSFVAYLRPEPGGHAADRLPDGGWSRADGLVVFEGSPRANAPKVPIEMTADAAPPRRAGSSRSRGPTRAAARPRAPVTRSASTMPGA